MNVHATPSLMFTSYMIVLAQLWIIHTHISSLWKIIVIPSAASNGLAVDAKLLLLQVVARNPSICLHLFPVKCFFWIVICELLIQEHMGTRVSYNRIQACFLLFLKH